MLDFRKHSAQELARAASLGKALYIALENVSFQMDLLAETPSAGQEKFLERDVDYLLRILFTDDGAV